MGIDFNGYVGFNGGITPPNKANEVVNKTPDANKITPIPSTDGTWADFGVEINKKPEVFSEEDLEAFVSQYATNISPETTDNVSEAMPAILSAIDNGIKNVPEKFQDAYVGLHVDGTADRVADNIVAITEFANTPEDIEMAALLFRDAEYLKGAA